MLEQHLISDEDKKILEEFMPQSGQASEIPVLQALWCWNKLQKSAIKR